jgi:threonine synthase
LTRSETTFATQRARRSSLAEEVKHVREHNVQGLRCRECEAQYPIQARAVCDECFGPVEVVYDFERIRSSINAEAFPVGDPSLWRYAPLLPDLAPDLRVDLGAGWTPLRRASRLGDAVGLSDVWIKNDTVNPTGSFKDRVVSVALSVARVLGFDMVACASTGNLAGATAAAAAAAGMRCYVFVPRDLERAKIVSAAVYGATVVAVDGSYDQANRLCSEIAEAYPWAFVNASLRPYYAEGSKTLAFETAEQLGWTLPDHVVVPIASGALLTKIRQGFEEVAEAGLVHPSGVRVSGAQATGCSPVSRAFREGSGEIHPQRPATIARSLAIGDPADGAYALSAVRETGGAIEDVSDEEIREAIRLLARTEGIFAETAGGVTIAVLRKLRDRGVIDERERTVAYVTGNGLKTVDALEASMGPALEVRPTIESFEAAGGQAPNPIEVGS